MVGIKKGGIQRKEAPVHAGEVLIPAGTGLTGDLTQSH
jgi:hypothetical protein